MKTCCRRIGIVILLLVSWTVGEWGLAPPTSATNNGYASYHFEPDSSYTQNDSKAVLKILADISGLPDHRVTWKDPLGEVAACPGCSTTYEYSANGGIVSSTSDFFIAGQQRLSGTYTAVVTYCSNTVGSTCLGWAEMFRADFTISEALVTFIISGNAGVAAAGLSYFDGTAKVVEADSSGAYTITVPSGWSGTVVPAEAHFVFSPESKRYTNVLTDQTDQDYVATWLNDWSYLPLMIR